MTTIKKKRKETFGEDVEKLEPMCTVGRNINFAAAMENRFLKILNISLAF